MSTRGAVGTFLKTFVTGLVKLLHHFELAFEASKCGGTRHTGFAHIASRKGRILQTRQTILTLLTFAPFVASVRHAAYASCTGLANVALLASYAK